VWGDGAYLGTAAACMLSNLDDDPDCACVKENFDQTSDPDCFLFKLYDGDDDCGANILDLPPVIHKSYSLALGASFAMLILSLFACGSVCCPGTCGTVEDAGEDVNVAAGGDSSALSSNDVVVAVASPITVSPYNEVEPQQVKY
jgi:hypothetical protein